MNKAEEKRVINAKIDFSGFSYKNKTTPSPNKPNANTRTPIREFIKQSRRTTQRIPDTVVLVPRDSSPLNDTHNSSQKEKISIFEEQENDDHHHFSPSKRTKDKNSPEISIFTEPKKKNKRKKQENYEDYLISDEEEEEEDSIEDDILSLSELNDETYATPKKYKKKTPTNRNLNKTKKATYQNRSSPLTYSHSPYVSPSNQNVQYSNLQNLAPPTLLPFEVNIYQNPTPTSIPPHHHTTNLPMYTNYQNSPSSPYQNIAQSQMNQNFSSPQQNQIPTQNSSNIESINHQVLHQNHQNESGHENKTLKQQFSENKVENIDLPDISTREKLLNTIYQMNHQITELYKKQIELVDGIMPDSSTNELAHLIKKQQEEINQLSKNVSSVQVELNELGELEINEKEEEIDTIHHSNNKKTINHDIYSDRDGIGDDEWEEIENTIHDSIENKDVEQLSSVFSLVLLKGTFDQCIFIMENSYSFLEILTLEEVYLAFDFVQIIIANKAYSKGLIIIYFHYIFSYLFLL